MFTQMSDSILAAIIAGTATLSASFMQLRTAALRDRGQPGSAARRKNRLQRIVFLVIVSGAGVSGFALSQSISVAARLGIADLLKDGPKGSDELAKSAGVDKSALARLLRRT